MRCCRLVQGDAGSRQYDFRASSIQGPPSLQHKSRWVGEPSERRVGWGAVVWVHAWGSQQRHGCVGLTAGSPRPVAAAAAAGAPLPPLHQR